MRFPTRRFRYLFVIHGLPAGGAEKFLISLLSYFSNSGIKCNLILLSNDLTLINDVSSEIEIIQIPFYRKVDLSALSKIKKYVNQVNPDLIICINAYSYFMTKIALFLSHKRKICLSHHSTVPFSYINYFQTYLYFLFSSSSDLIIYLCYAQKSYLKEKYKINMKNDSVIYNGIDNLFLNLGLLRNHSKSTQNAKRSNMVILMVARISPEKNHKAAILALKLLHNKYKCSVELHFLGSGHDNYVLQLKSFISYHGLSSHVKFLGFKHDVGNYYSSADLFLLTSSSETFPLSVIEAMSFGIPSVITNVGGASELIVEGFNGYTVPVGDINLIAEKCHLVLNRVWDHIKISNYAKDKFNKETMLASYSNVFNEYILS